MAEPVGTLNEDELLVYPNACALCNQGERGHGQTWHWLVGFHGWVEPNDTLRLYRMMKIREERLRGAA